MSSVQGLVPDNTLLAVFARFAYLSIREIHVFGLYRVVGKINNTTQNPTRRWRGMGGALLPIECSGDNAARPSAHFQNTDYNKRSFWPMRTNCRKRFCRNLYFSYLCDAVPVVPLPDLCAGDESVFFLLYLTENILPFFLSAGYSELWYSKGKHSQTFRKVHG